MMAYRTSKNERSGIAMNNSQSAPNTSHFSVAQNTSVHNVNFQPHNNSKRDEEKRKKFLTAKYDEHQLNLIKCRLEVESWIWDELRILYDSEDDSYDCEIDLEDLLNCEEEEERRVFLLEKLRHAKVSQDLVDKFINELLAKARKL
ncbi:protein phosphatase 1 regulatory subunit 14C-like [Tubulanus polymorphus]|uniref:protein phosphatase 1 regulatory subunit 14C-like n=1 Tax=Tubulanus polymorphus TaxID=672921 RepID=UPI003DA3ACAC